MAETEERKITELGDPSAPKGEAGREMLKRMNRSHYDVSGWGLGFLTFSGNEKVLDIGCGGGETLSRMAEKITSGHLVGADVSDISVEMSTERNRDSISSGKMEIIKASAEELPFPDNTFDIITTVESFYFWNTEKSLKEVRRVLSVNGTFIIIADIYGGADLTDEQLYNIRKYDLFNPSPDEFTALLTNAGFTGVKIHLKDNTTWICAEGHK